MRTGAELLCCAPAVESRGGEERRGEEGRGEGREGGEERREGEERRGDGSRWERMEDEGVAEGERKEGKEAEDMGEDRSDSLEYRVQEREQLIWQKRIDWWG